VKPSLIGENIMSCIKYIVRWIRGNKSVGDMKCDPKNIPISRELRVTNKYINIFWQLIFSFCRPIQKPRLYFRCERASKARRKTSNYAWFPSSKKITSRYYTVFCASYKYFLTLEISASIFYQILKCFLIIITHM
jgi:hypothetical protein